jgi:hypothetical protein
VRKLLLAAVVVIVFDAWFADGYLQWVNSDTAGIAWGSTQDIGFPYSLLSGQHSHSRLTAAILMYVPFHMVGYLYRELTDDPVVALFVSQGVMTGAIYVLLVLVSALYVSFWAPLLSMRFIISAAFLALFAMALPAQDLNATFTVGLRFFHQTVMVNYVGTMAVALCTLLPYWRYVCVGKWDDWYSDVRLRTLFYIGLIAACLSATATMLWLGIFAAVALPSIVVSKVWRLVPAAL